MIPPIPLATYRLQFNSGFTFNDARKIVPYLHALGISHCYASPILKARSGSSHGYDIVDHNALNPELGTIEEFRLFVDTLHAHGMGLILDIVPNHMGIGGSDNAWWLDVLENGPASPYADYFDIDWQQPATRVLSGKVLLPILGDYYGNVLDRGEIRLIFLAEQGGFAASYYEHLLPIDPKTYPQILGPALSFLNEQQPATRGLYTRLAHLLAALKSLPGRQAGSRSGKGKRRDQQIACKQGLALLFQEPWGEKAIAHSLSLFNDQGKGKERFKLLHRLLEKQAYRLAFWKVAADEINYRRFFNINTLAGLRQEQAEVFKATHRFLFDLIEQGLVQGLRIDHPDGLFDPKGYFDRLRGEISLRLPPPEAQPGKRPLLYLLVEKILAVHEGLPQEWPVHGTTGYDFANLVNGLFIEPAGEEPLSRLYHLCTGRKTAYDEELYAAKRLIIKAQLGSEMTVLANLLRHLAEQDPHTRDFTLTGLREALTEVVACFPIYRTYVTAQKVNADDRRHVEWALRQAKERNPVTDPAVFDFVRDSLLLAKPFGKRRGIRSRMASFAMKFQQYTAPVTAKAEEDTVFYRDFRLLSLNEVGGDPRRFSVSRIAFHQANTIRLQHWPQAMLATSTHDSKRGEDVRARLNVLSEIPDFWKQRVRRWQKLNRRHSRQLGGQPAPSRNDEYLLYQTLLGTWPVHSPIGLELHLYGERIAAYMLKAVREAKVRSSWHNPNSAYEEAVASFVAALLDPDPANRFLADFAEFSEKLSRFGFLNSLSQLLLKLTAPGVPDIYQGNELWGFSLVDPDNRRPVDFKLRQSLLAELDALFAEDASAVSALASLQESLADGRAKLFVTSRVLRFRQKHPDLFRQGAYEELTITGKAEGHLCVFGRSSGCERLLVVAPRFLASLLVSHDLCLGAIPVSAWGQTRLFLPETWPANSFRNIFSGEVHTPNKEKGRLTLSVPILLRSFPVAVLCASGKIVEESGWHDRSRVLAVHR